MSYKIVYDVEEENFINTIFVVVCLVVCLFSVDMTTVASIHEKE